MKKRFGGLLAVALGTVLILNGLSQSGDGAVGLLGRACGAGQIGLAQSTGCPVGGITITDVTPAAAGLPADFDVTIASTNCLGTDGQPVNRTVTVPTGGSAGTGDTDLYVYTNQGSDENGAKCLYTLTREVNPQYTATFTPASPVTIPFSNNDRTQSQRVREVTLLNQAVTAPTTSTAPSTSAAPSTSIAASTSASAEPTEVGVSSSAAPASDTQDAAPIAETGPSQPVKASLWLGIGLLLLGLFLLFEGRVRTLARHRR